MEPAPLRSRNLDGTPAPQVDLTDTDDGSGRAGGIDHPGMNPGMNPGLHPGMNPGLNPGVDVSFTSAARDDEGEVPYLRKRIPTDAGGLATPTPMVDLTDLAVALPETPPPIVELQPLPALDPADATGVTPLPVVARPSRLALSRPRLAGLGVLAFSAGLLTAATAGVLARPARTVSVSQSAPVAQSAPAQATPAPSADPVGASAPVLVASEATAPAAPGITAPATPSIAPTEARDVIAPAPAAPADSAVVVAAPAATTAAAPVGKARGKTSAPVRGRAHTPNRNRSGTRVDSSAGQSQLAAPATEAEPGDVLGKEAPAPAPPPAAAPRRRADWVDPFAQ